MLSALFIALLVPLPVATVALVLQRPHGVRRSPTGVPGRTAWAVGAAVSGAAVLLALGVPTSRVAVAAAVTVAAVLAWTPLCRRWSARGQLAWGLGVAAGAAYVAVMLEVTLTSGLPALGLAGGLVLSALEVVALVLGSAYLWEVVDVLSSLQWDRRAGLAPVLTDDALPFVSVHVPAHNEPPEMVIATLRSLLALDYPRYEVVMLDDNTDDPALWEPVEAFARQHPEVIRFHHLQDWPGYKAGALNYAMTVMDPRTEVVAVVDADYLVQPDWLCRCSPYFADEQVAFVQTPQDYRDWDTAPYYRWLYYGYDYFFAVSQRSRDERDGAIFGGTMGLVRRRALEEVGGWDEWCITEDAELSLRLLRAGWSGRHLDESYGHGIMPLTFPALKRQRFRWCFGGVQILRRHGRSLLPWDRSPDNHLTQAQRWAYLSGGLQWFADLLGLVLTVLLLMGAADAVLDGGTLFRRVGPLLLATVPALAVLGVLRSVAVIKATGAPHWRDALGAFLLWLSLSWTVAMACARGVVRSDGVFMRTPKTRDEISWRDAVRTNRVEVTLALLTGVAAVAVLAVRPGLTGGLLALMLGLQVIGPVMAPLNTLAAARADLPADLRRRRRSEGRRAWDDPRNRRRAGAAAALVALGTAASALLLAAPAAGPPPRQSVLPRARHSGAHARPAPSTTAGRTPPTTGTSGTSGPPATAPGTTSSRTTAARPSTTTSAAPAPTSRSTVPTVAPTTLPTQASASRTTTRSTRSTPSPTTRGGHVTGSPTSPPGRP